VESLDEVEKSDELSSVLPAQGSGGMMIFLGSFQFLCFKRTVPTCFLSSATVPDSSVFMT